jgi:hypothetical protein
MRIRIDGIRRIIVDDVEMDGRFRGKLELYGGRRSSESMLDLEGEEMVFSREVEIGVGPSGDITAAAESLPWILSSGFSGVVNE